MDALPVCCYVMVSFCRERNSHSLSTGCTQRSLIIDLITDPSGKLNTIFFDGRLRHAAFVTAPCALRTTHAGSIWQGIVAKQPVRPMSVLAGPGGTDADWHSTETTNL